MTDKNVETNSNNRFNLCFENNNSYNVNLANKQKHRKKSFRPIHVRGD